MKIKTLLFSVVIMGIMLFSLASCSTASTPEVVEKEKIVEQTVIVEKEVTVEKMVVETIVVEKEKVVEVTPIPEPTATPITEPKSGGTLQVGMASTVESFDPYSLSWTAFPIRAQLYDTLIRYDHDASNPQPWLAESWEISEDGLIVTIKLRQGVKFHNGRELVADDVLQNLDKARDPERCLHMCSLTKKIESYEAPDDYTVVIHYSEIYTGWQDFLDDFFIVAPESFDTLKEGGIGTGPFKFEEFLPGDHFTLVKNEDYWGSDGPYVDKVVWNMYGTDTDAMVAAFESGALDIAQDIPFREYSRLSRSGYSIYTGQPGALFEVLYVNPLTVKDKRVRQAIQYALNREAIQDAVFYGAGEIWWSPYPKDHWVYDTEFENYYPYDLEKAKALVQEAGAEGLTLTFSAFNQEYAAMGVILRDDLKKIGINLEVRLIDSTQFYNDLYNYSYELLASYGANSNKDPDRLFSGSQWRVYPASTMIVPPSVDPDAFWPVHMETGEAYGDLIAEGSTTLDQDRRREIYIKLQEILLEESWSINWLRRDALFGTQPYVQGLDWRLDDGLVLENVWLAH